MYDSTLIPEVQGGTLLPVDKIPVVKVGEVGPVAKSAKKTYILYEEVKMIDQTMEMLAGQKVARLIKVAIHFSKFDGTIREFAGQIGVHPRTVEFWRAASVRMALLSEHCPALWCIPKLVNWFDELGKLTVAEFNSLFATLKNAHLGDVLITQFGEHSGPRAIESFTTLSTAIKDAPVKK
ncbi:hypothetical protein BC941DRAFT_440842 [Chlamydoabsidia padenii]|nr:hypothetical protein BC941DRAFT_440842 [Chlamydoabsidia padenii]